MNNYTVGDRMSARVPQPPNTVNDNNIQIIHNQSRQSI